MCFGLEKPSPCPSRVVQAQLMIFKRCGRGDINPKTLSGILPVKICGAAVKLEFHEHYKQTAQ